MTDTVEVPVDPPTVVEVLTGQPGPQGPAGPVAVSADDGNAATIGQDGLIYVPPTTGGASNWGDLGGALSDQADLQAALDGKSATSHAHAQSDVTGLEAALAGKSDAAHTHSQSDVTGLDTSLAGKANTSHSHATSDVTGLDTALAGKANSSHTHAQSEVTGLVSALAEKSDTGHSHTAAQISDFDTAADARVAAGITGKLDASAAPELIRDTMGTALVAGSNVTITPSDAGDTITVAASGLVTNSGTVTSVVSITRTAYDALGTPNATTLYVIDESA